MPITVTCPGCSAKMNALDTAAGKKIKCPKCQGAISVPAAKAQADFEVVEDQPAPAKKPAFGSGVAKSKIPPADVVAVAVEDEKPAKKAKAAVDEDEDDKPRKKAKAVVEEDEDEAPRKKKRNDEEDPKKKAKAVAEDDFAEEVEEDDKPRKKKAAAEADEEEKPRKKKRSDEEDEDDRPTKKKKKGAEDDEDDRPRKKKKKGAEGGTSMARNIIGVVVLLILLGVVGFIYYGKFVKKDEDTTTKPSDPPSGPPSGPPGPRIPPGGQPGPKGPGGGPGPGNPGPKLPLEPAGLTLWEARPLGVPVMSPDGQLVLALDLGELGGQFVRVWDAQTGNPYANVGDGKIPIAGYGISPDKKQLATVSLDASTMALWSLPAGQLEKTIKLGAEKDIISIPPFVTYTPDGKSVVTAHGNKLVRVDVLAGQERVIRDGVSTFSAVYCARKNLFVEIGISMETGSFVLHVFDLTAGGPPKTIAGGKDENLFAHLDISGDGKTVAIGVINSGGKKESKAIHLYDVASGQLKARIPFAVAGAETELAGASLSSDGNRVFVWGIISRGGKITFSRVLATGTGEVVRTVGLGEQSVLSVSRFAPEGTTAITFADQGARIYDAKTDTERTK